jgi:hypothetical protein
MSARASAASVRQRAAGLFVDDADIINALTQLEPRVFSRVLKSASNKAMTPVVKGLRAALRADGLQESGLLIKSIGKKAKTYKRAHTHAVIVGARSMKQLVSVPAFPGSVSSRAGTRMIYRNPVAYFNPLESGHRGRGRRVRPGGTRRQPRTEPISGHTQPHRHRLRVLARNRGRILRLISSEAGVAMLRHWSRETRA